MIAAAIFDFQLSHLLRNHPRIFVETLHMNPSQCLDVSARKWFWSVKKYLKSWTCPLVNTVTSSLSHLLRDHWPDFLKLVWDVQLVYSCVRPKMVLVRRQISPAAAIFDFTVIVSFPKPLRNFIETLHMIFSQCWDMFTRKRFCSINKYGLTATVFKIANCT